MAETTPEATWLIYNTSHLSKNWIVQAEIKELVFMSSSKSKGKFEAWAIRDFVKRQSGRPGNFWGQLSAQPNCKISFEGWVTAGLYGT